MFSFDLKAGYHHVDIHEEYWQYLGFAWDNEGAPKYYVFVVLPFGLATVCYLFTKLLRPLTKYWRGQGLRVIIYLDDGIVSINGKEAAGRASQQVRGDLQRAGLIEHTDKCIWTPTQCLNWLGFDIDLARGMVQVPLEAVCNQIGDALQSKTLPARSLASITGKLISMSIALGPVTRLMTRGLYALINIHNSWCHTLTISPEAIKELQFWLGQINNFNGQNMWHSPSAIRVVYSDASSSGYGGYLVEHGCHIAHGQWLPNERTQSLTW